jgi:hypothetical protein
VVLHQKPPLVTLLGGVGVLVVGTSLSTQAHYLLNVHCNALSIPPTIKHTTVAALAAASLQVRSNCVPIEHREKLLPSFKCTMDLCIIYIIR